MKIRIVNGPSHQSMWYSKKDIGKEFRVLKVGRESYFDYGLNNWKREDTYWVLATDGYLNWIWASDAEIIE